jgi:hypothetical protein
MWLFVGCLRVRLLAPPALCERRHRVLAGRLIVRKRKAIRELGPGGFHGELPDRRFRSLSSSVTQPHRAQRRPQ